MPSVPLIGSISPRVALAIVFAIRGFMIGNWIARIPAIAEHLGVSRTELGTVLIAGAIGALVSFQVTAPRIAKWGTARSISMFGPMWAMAIPLAMFAPSPVMFFLMFLLYGFANGTVDVALNAQAVEIERRIATPIMSSMHGFFSVGALIGTGVGAMLAAMSVPIQPQFLVIGLAVVAIWMLMMPRLVPDEAVEAVPGHARRRPIFSIGPRVLWPLGAIAFACGIMEESLADWGALFLSQDLGTNEGTAAMGYTIFSCTMLVGRLFGDPLVRRVGPVAILRGGTAIGAAGVLIGVLLNTPWAFLLTFALVGLGFSTIIPIVYRAAGSIPGVPRAEGVASVATVCYSAFLVGPPMMGFISDQSSLRTAFTLVGLLVTVIIVLAPAVSRLEVSASTQAAPESRALEPAPQRAA